MCTYNTNNIHCRGDLDMMTTALGGGGFNIRDGTRCGAIHV